MRIEKDNGFSPARNAMDKGLSPVRREDKPIVVTFTSGRPIGRVSASADERAGLRADRPIERIVGGGDEKAGLRADTIPAIVRFGMAVPGGGGGSVSVRGDGGSAIIEAKKTSI